MKLIAVPGAHEVHVVLIETLAEIGAAFSDQVDHLRQLEALADRTALMRAQIAVGVVAALVADHTDLDRPDLDQPHVAVGDLAFPAHQYFVSHTLSLSLVRLSIAAIRPARASRNPPIPE